MKKYDIILVDLNPVKWSEQSWVRPCIVLQNNIANKSLLKTATIAPITSSIKNVTSAVIIKQSVQNWLDKKSRIELSQIRTIDKQRLIKTIWSLDDFYKPELNEKLSLFFDLHDDF